MMEERMDRIKELTKELVRDYIGRKVTEEEKEELRMYVEKLEKLLEAK